jgi:hypothetical protein
MAAGINSKPHSRLRLALSLLCVFALLVVSVPCAMCAPQGAVQQVTMAATHCDDCCSSGQMASSAKSCCAVQSPAAVSAIQAIHAAPACDGLPAYQPVVAAALSHLTETTRAVHPPLPKTNLRI